MSHESLFTTELTNELKNAFTAFLGQSDVRENISVQLGLEPRALASLDVEIKDLTFNCVEMTNSTVPIKAVEGPPTQLPIATSLTESKVEESPTKLKISHKRKRDSDDDYVPDDADEDDEEEHRLCSRRKPRRGKAKRSRFNENQLLMLESFFGANLLTTKNMRDKVARASGITQKQMRTWVMNRKAKERKGFPPLRPRPTSGRGFSPTQRQQLTAFFELGLLSVPMYREAVAKATGLTEKRVRIWQQNFKAKLRREGKLFYAGF